MSFFLNFLIFLTNRSETVGMGDFGMATCTLIILAEEFV